MAIYKTYDFTRILSAAKEPANDQKLAIALTDIAHFIKEIEKRFHAIEERIGEIEIKLSK